jgi:ADP-ribosylglycohydrolase
MEDALKVVPTDSIFYKELSWALSIKDTVQTPEYANELVTKRYPSMSWVHAVNNACLTVWGIHIGQEDFDKGIGDTVAMAYDNDCTAATVGSVLGAYLGINAINPKWYTPWNNRILSYLKGIPEFKLDDVIERFYTIHQRLRGATNETT